MENLKYIMVISKDGDGYLATFPEIPGCFTGAETLEELRTLADDVVRLYLSALHDDGQEIPDGVGDGVIETLVIKNDPAEWKKDVRLVKPMEAV